MKSEAHLHHGPANCPNCGSALSGNFCQECGQAAILHVPSAREFLHEFVAHYVALEGKLWQSVKLLLFKPGQLTREYIEGRRVRYVEPATPVPELQHHLLCPVQAQWHQYRHPGKGHGRAKAEGVRCAAGAGRQQRAGRRTARRQAGGQRQGQGKRQAGPDRIRRGLA
ncbi:DUF3667 domain-containing protein [Massilia brevitalea]|uniref:DUF3667 domain-containing protein n=1 Tax=Massilia brevitalea TaxID=442526 RepID=UPI002738D32F|nr:DUF3667 domain-containing protein [Massilia brevitalea]